MQVSFRWLKDYVDIELDPKVLADKLTMAGLEVEAVQEYRPAFEGVVVAKVLAVRPHPDADKLSLCEVTTGEKTYPVVCGAVNVKAGDLVPLAMVGASLPGGYTIKSSKIRGEQSEGMLCSEEELGIGPDHTGILHLPSDRKLGQDLADALNLSDVILDVGVTPNRADCLSILGIAREVAAVTGKKLRSPAIRFTEKGEKIEKCTAVDIIDPDLCPRYTARLIKGLTIKPAPQWMRLRLEAAGVRSINNVVDATNFVMIEMGQPLHAFDFRFLEEGRIVVRRSSKGEEFISLDGKLRVLKDETLMICDGKKAVAIAGIMGGENSEVKDDTDTILLESAYFNPIAIRRASRWLGMGTDAAFRFGRGVDPEGVVRALDRAAQLIAEMSGGNICKGYIDRYPLQVESPDKISLRVSKVKDILGDQIEKNEIKKILTSLEMKVKSAGKGCYSVTPPTFRGDISREIDLIEEVARIHGYHKVPSSIPNIPPRNDLRDRRKTVSETILSIVKGCGYSEVINYSFTATGSADILCLNENDVRRRFVRIANPLTEDQSIMRTTLIFGLLEVLKRNNNIGCADLKIVEQGRIFLADDNSELPIEREKIAGLLTGSRYDNLWHFNDVLSDFYDLKGCIENILDGLKVKQCLFQSAVDIPFLHPGRACRVFIGGDEAGILGEVHPDVLQKMDLNGRAMVFEIDVDTIVASMTGITRYKEYSSFPAVMRDVAFLVDRELESHSILNLIRAGGEELLEAAGVFDVYDGKGIEADRKSLGLRFTYRSSNHTLTDEEVSLVHGKIIEEVIKLTGAKIRGIDN
jgi:phenylalanyl-tRNA synthetase beta chain